MSFEKKTAILEYKIFVSASITPNDLNQIRMKMPYNESQRTIPVIKELREWFYTKYGIILNLRDAKEIVEDHFDSQSFQG